MLSTQYILGICSLSLTCLTQEMPAQNCVIDAFLSSIIYKAYCDYESCDLWNYAQNQLQRLF